MSPRTLILTCSTVLVTHPAFCGDLKSEATTILDARNGTIAKWDVPPKFVHIKSVGEESQYLGDLIQIISETTSLSIPALEMVEIDPRDVGPEFVRNSKFGIVPRDDGSFFVGFKSGVAQPKRATGNIFVFDLVEGQTEHLILQSQFGDVRSSLSRNFAYHDNPCFFYTYSTKGELHFATVFIGGWVDDASREECLYEEVMQTMGLLNDAKGSSTFTFDDEMNGIRSDADRTLLSALYQPQFRPGDDVEDVIRWFQEEIKKRDN